MKPVIRAARRLAGLVVSLLFVFGQQALAAGTPAGTVVTNQAQVDYQVGGVVQEFILSSPGGNSTPGAGAGATTDFTVDNRVDFTLLESGDLNHTPVTPGQPDNVVEFQLTNTGNSPQDFRLVATNLVGVVVDGLTDDTQMEDPPRIYVDADGSGTPDLVNDLNYVDELAPDTAVTIFVVADAPLTLVNGNVANVELSARVADADGVGGTLGSDTNDDAGVGDTIDTVQVVFGDDGDGVVGDGTEAAQDGYTVASAALTVTKASLLLSDPFNGGTNPKHIPGAVVQYTITVGNSGTEDATSVVLSDPLTDVLPIGNVVVNDGVSNVSSCTASDADADFCGFTGGTLTIGPDASLDVPAGGQRIVTFQVEIQ